MLLLIWLETLLSKPKRIPVPLGVRVEALAGHWQVEPVIAWHLVRTYAARSLISMEAPMGELQGLSCDEMTYHVGENDPSY